MNKLPLFLLPCCLFLGGLLFSCMIARAPVSQENDAVAFSRIAKEAGAHWTDPENASFDHFPYPISILDLEGNIRYRSSEEAVTSIGQAIKKGCLILDVETGGEIVGRIIYSTSMETRLSGYQQSIALLVFLFTLLLTAAISIYLYYLNRKILRPFKELKRFATEVSQGNLDFPLTRERNNLFGAFTESFDLMREQLMTAREKERESVRNRKELVATLSHDIRTPVTSIQLTAELLLELEPDEKLRAKIGNIYQKTGQIQELVNNLFHTTLHDMEQLTVVCREMYGSIAEALIREADYKGRVKFSPIPPCMILADEMRLSQIFSNIISNSYKYADTELRLDASLTDSHLKLSLQDYGHGAAEDELPFLCNKFYRGSNVAQESGSGLGLYICKELMELMQGEIYCTSSTGGFTVSLLLKLV